MRFVSGHKSRVRGRAALPRPPHYDATSRAPSARSRRDELLKTAIVKVHEDNYGIYGTDQAHCDLSHQPGSSQRLIATTAKPHQALDPPASESPRRRNPARR